MITHVAIKHDDGRIFSLPKPYRHHHIIWTITDICNEKFKGSFEQGFLTENGDFIDRKEAYEIAFTCGQILDVDKSYPPNLCSEDLW